MKTLNFPSTAVFALSVLALIITSNALIGHSIADNFYFIKGSLKPTYF